MFETEMIGSVVACSEEWRLWFNATAAHSLSASIGVAIAGGALAPEGETNVCSDGLAAGLRPDRPPLCAAVVDGRDTPAGTGGRRDEDQGHRAGTAELARPRDPGRQLLRQPIRTAAVVLHPDRTGDAAAPCRSVHRPDVVGVRGHPLR